MYTEVSRHDFARAFQVIRPDNFSREGLDHLFDHLTHEEDEEDQKELDVIMICCAFTEYESLAEFHRDHDKEDYPDIDAIRERTTVLEVDDGFIIEAF